MKFQKLTNQSNTLSFEMSFLVSSTYSLEFKYRDTYITIYKIREPVEICFMIKGTQIQCSVSA